MHAYLGITASGAFALYVSTSVLNPAGTRLERGPRRRLPESVRSQALDPSDPQAAIQGLISLHRFLRGEEQGPGALEFGVDHLPLVRRKAK